MSGYRSSSNHKFQRINEKLNDFSGVDKSRYVRLE